MSKYWDQGRHQIPILTRLFRSNCFSENNIDKSNNEEVERYCRFPNLGEFHKWLNWRNQISRERNG